MLTYQQPCGNIRIEREGSEMKDMLPEYHAFLKEAVELFHKYNAKIGDLAVYERDEDDNEYLSEDAPMVIYVGGMYISVEEFGEML